MANYPALLLRSASAFSMFICAPVMAQTADAPDGSTAEAQDQEIVVTASKREERLRDVPSAITALTSETLETQGIKDFRDYATLVPGLAQRDLGAPGLGTVILRGLNTGPAQSTPTTAFYIGETPFTAAGFITNAALFTPAPDIADLERIEVLKGPQGTLYGASSLGGLVRFVLKKPDATRMSGDVRVEMSAIDGGGVGYGVHAAINVPLVTDVLAVRASGFYRRAPGFTDNVGTGTKNVNRSDLYGGRVGLRFTPSADLSIDLSGEIQNIDNEGYAQVDTISGTLKPIYGPYKYRNFGDFGAKLKYRIASANVDYDVGPGSIVTTASYAYYNSLIELDYTDSYVPLARASLAPVSTLLFGVPIDTLIPANSKANATNSPRLKKISAETRFVSKRLGPVQFVVGAFYTDEENYVPIYLYLTDVNGVRRAPPFDMLLRSESPSTYREIAGFGNATFYLADNLDVTGGIRYARNKQHIQIAGDRATLFFLPRAHPTFDTTQTATTYLATVRWRPTDRLSLYARAASGYRPGGPQNNPTPPPGAQTVIRPDSVWNYEAGMKGTFLDGRLSADLSVFRIDWSDIQLNTLVGGVALQGNAGAAVVDGFELSLLARPSHMLSVGANIGHTNARITKVDAGVSTSIGARAGDRLPLTPGWTAAVFADQQIAFSSDLTGSLGATLRFQSDMPSSYPGSLLNPNIKLPEITTLDLRGGLDFGQFRLQARVENLFDRIGYTTAVTNKLFPAQPVPTQVTVIRPRTFSLSVGFEF
jgi:outer membrane receptor protein involved in Fe transport